MGIVKKELIKSFEFEVDGIDFPIKGWVYKTDELERNPYRWEISHYYRPNEQCATVYRPSRKHAETAEEAQYLLERYASEFVNLDVVPA